MVTIFHDKSHRAEQAFALSAELEKLELRRDIIISCGLEAVEEAAAAKQGGEFLVSIGDPKNNHDEFDALVLPSHEPFPEHDNIISTTGLLNKISPNFLAQQPVEEFENLSRPQIAVLLGGRHVGGDVTQVDVGAILDGIKTTKLVSTSRRTNADLKIDADFVYNFNRDGQDANPYLSMLSASDALVVTADSARMMSEAGSSGKPTYIYSPTQLHFSYAALRDKLFEGGYARDFADLSGQITPTKPLAEAKRVAELLANQL